MSNLELLRETSRLISKDLFDNDEFHPDAPDYSSLKNILAVRITELLKTNLNELLRILYRIDIAEHKLKNAFKCMSEEEIADQIAILVIERQMQKVEFRRKYSNNNGEV